MVYTYPIPEFTTLRSQTEESMASYKNLLQIGDEVKQLDFEGRMYDTEAEVEVAVDGCGYRVLWDVGDEHLYLIIPKGTEKVRMLVDSSVVEVRLDEERSGSKSIKPPSYTTNNLPLVASLLASPHP